MDDDAGAQSAHRSLHGYHKDRRLNKVENRYLVSHPGLSSLAAAIPILHGAVSPGFIMMMPRSFATAQVGAAVSGTGFC